MIDLPAGRLTCLEGEPTLPGFVLDLEAIWEPLAGAG